MEIFKQIVNFFHQLVGYQSWDENIECLFKEQGSQREKSVLKKSFSQGSKQAKKRTTKLRKAVRSKTSKSKVINKVAKQLSSKHDSENSSSRLSDIILENSSQFNSIKQGKKAEIIIGFDFGTSTTKIIVRASNFPDNPVFAVPFGRFSDIGSQYLIPTRLFVGVDGVCSLESHDINDSHLAAIKVALMEDPDRFIEVVSGDSCDISAKFIAVAYIALVLRYVRCWFLENQKDAFEGYLIEWFFNLGIPAAKLDYPSGRSKIFKIVGMVAWLVSLESGAIRIESIKKIFKEFEGKENIDIDVCVIPEIVAEVHGYAQSPFKREGLHLLIDAGATTLDINGFMLGQGQGVNKYSILLANIKDCGAMILHGERIEKVEEILNQKLENSNIVDTSQLVPDSLENYSPSGIDKEQRSEIISALKNVDFNFRREKAFWKYISIMLQLLRTKKNPYDRSWSEVPALRKELPVILGGGASAMSLYRNIVEEDINDWLKDFVSSDFCVRLVSLPVPESLKDEIDEASYHRLAVAWGLSFADYNIGDYSLPSEIKIDRKPSYRNDSDNFIDSSQV